MVCNVTLSGINTSLWDPYFALLTFLYTLQVMDGVTYMEDRFIGEMLIIFMMSEEVRPLCGFDLNKHNRGRICIIIYQGCCKYGIENGEID